MQYEIWKCPMSCRYKFMGSDFIKERGEQITIEDYVYVYGGEIDTDEYVFADIYELLEHLFYIFNEDHPCDYHSSSMSTSDIIRLPQTNEFYYVDFIGFKPLDYNKSNNKLNFKVRSGYYRREINEY